MCGCAKLQLSSICRTYPSCFLSPRSCSEDKPLSFTTFFRYGFAVRATVLLNPRNVSPQLGFRTMAIYITVTVSAAARPVTMEWNGIFGIFALRCGGSPMLESAKFDSCNVSELLTPLFRPAPSRLALSTDVS